MSYGVLFLPIIVHELSHFLVGSYMGIAMSDVTFGVGPTVYTNGLYHLKLFPLAGSVTPDQGQKQSGLAYFLMILAGPVSNFIFATVVVMFFYDDISFSSSAVGSTYKEGFYTILHGNVISYLFHTNVILGVMNLLPIYPCDGGRIAKLFVDKYLPNMASTVFSTCGFILMAISIMTTIWYEIKSF